MARAIGFHRLGERVSYALIERAVDAPPEVLAAGHCSAEEVGEVYARLCAERALPWGLAEEHHGKRATAPDADLGLRRPNVRAMVHPAVAAAVWEWELGRLSENDLFFWLRPERLLWSAGEPGIGPSGGEARRGPLGESVQRTLLKAGSIGAEVVVAVEGDAPGATTLLKTLEERGRKSRPIKRPASERGADRAALGAAIGALEIARPGFFAPVRPKSRDPWLWTASFLAAAAVGGAAWVSRDEARAQEKPVEEASEPAQPNLRLTPASPELAKLLERRHAVVRAFEELPKSVPAGKLEEIEVLSAPGSARAQVHMRLLPGGANEQGEAQPVEWQQPLLPGFELKATEQADGSQTVRGEVGSGNSQ